MNFKSSWSNIKAGDVDAFKTLYREYADILFNYGLEFIPNEDLIAETIQSLFLYIYDKRARIATPISIQNYIITSFREHLHQELKKRYKLISTEKETHEQFLLQKAIDQLTTSQKEVINHES